MKQEKQLLLDEIKNQIASSAGFVLTQYSAMSANKANEFRKEMAKIGAHFEVVKKRVFIKAADQLDLKFDLDALSGHVGVVIAANDLLEATKAVIKFSDGGGAAFGLLGGLFDGLIVSAEEAVQLSKLPSKDVMRAEFLGLLEAPMASMLGVVDAALTSVIHCLNNKAVEPSAS